MKLKIKEAIVCLGVVAAPLMSQAEIKIPPANYFVLDQTCQAAQSKDAAIAAGTTCRLILRNGCPGELGLGPSGAKAFVSRKSNDGKSFQRVSPILEMKACAKDQESAKQLVIPFKVSTSGTYNFVNQRTGSNKGLVYYDFAVDTGDNGQVNRVSKKVKLFVKGK